MKNESNRIKIIMKQYVGEDQSSLTLRDVSNLQQQIELSLYKFRLRKNMDLIKMYIYGRFSSWKLN